jgi:Uma2 family endonuclease
MATATTTKLMTAQEFMAADLGAGNFELVRGEVVEVPPAMPEHGRVCGDVFYVLETYGRQTGRGYALSNDSAVQTERNPDTVRGADVCFYTHARWPRSEVGLDLPPVPPDLAVEVVSPGNRPGELYRKISEYLAAGVSLVWVVYPKQRCIVIHRPDGGAPLVLREDQVIENLPELPGFRCTVAEFFL